MDLRRSRREMLKAGLGFAALGGCSVSPALADPLPNGLRLLFVEDPGCSYCRTWMLEIGGSYDATPPGRVAPLVRRNMGDGSLAAFSRLQFTPTFILMRDGHEIDRAVGYAGPEAFWEGLAGMLAKANVGREPVRPEPNDAAETPDRDA